MAPTTIHFWFLTTVLVGAALLSFTQLAYRATGPRPVNWLTVDIIFLHTFLLIHLGYIFIYLTGIIDLQGYYLWQHRNLGISHRVCQCAAYSVSAIAVFLAGYNWAPEHFSRPYVLTDIPIPVRERWSIAGKALVRIGFLLFVGFVAVAGPAVFSGKYTGSNFGFIATTLYELARGSMAAGAAVMVISRAKYKGTWPVKIADSILIVVAIASMLIHGDRSSFLIIAVVVFATYAEFVRPFTLQRLVTATVVVAILFGISLSARMSGSRNLASFVTEGKTRWSEGIERSALNFSNSVLNLWVAAEHTEGDGQYYYGKLQLTHVAGIVPFSRTALGLTGKNTSGMVFTELIQGRVAQGVSGTGTTALADFYLDFGFVGSLIAFFAVGRYGKFVEQKSRAGTSILWAVHYCLMLGIFSTIARYTILGSFVRQILYPTMFTLLVLYFMGIRSRIIVRSRRPVMSYQERIRARSQPPAAPIQQ